MNRRQPLALVALVVGSGWLVAADEPTPEVFIRIEAQGKLIKTSVNGQEQYALARQMPKFRGDALSLLDLDDDATKKLAKELEGQFVVITGRFGGFEMVGDGKRRETKYPVLRISVSTIKKAELPKK